MKKNKIIDKKMVIGAISLFLFIILTILIITKVISPIDNSAESFIISIRNNHLTTIMTNITNIGSAYSLIAISLLLIFIIKNKRIPLSIILNLIIVFLSSQLFKIIFKRNRPDALYLVDASGYSYPSGHTMVSFAYFTFITYLLYKNITNKALRIIIVIANIIIVSAIAFSRIYLGVHYLSDVIAGILLGITYLAIYIKFIHKEVDKK